MKGCINKIGKSWGYTITIGIDQGGKRIQKRYGKFKTRKEAEKACNDAIYHIEHGTFVIPHKVTLEEYLWEWLSTYCKPNLTPCSYNGYRTNIEKHIIPALGNIPLQSLQPIHVQKLYNSKAGDGGGKRNKGLSPSSIRYIHAVLRKSLNQAVKMQYISRNVCDLVELPKIRRREAKFLDAKQVKILLDSFQGADIYIPTLLAIGLGLRRGELLGLQWKDFDFGKRSVTICRALLPYRNDDEIFSECKTSKSHRVIAVPDSMISTLKQARRKQLEDKIFFGSDYYDYDLVYCQPNGNPVSPNAFDHRFSKALKEHGFDHIRVHDLRHTNASLMLSQGVPMKVASERLGHTTISITMDLYSHIDDALQQDAADKLNNALCI